MRFLSVLTIGLVISSSAVAQNTAFEIHGTTSYTSRGNLSTGSGELLQGLFSSRWTGLGDSGAACNHTQIGLVDQDQNSVSQESFHLLTRAGTDATGPGTTGADIINRWGPFLMPSTATGSVNAWIQTVTIGGAGGTLPCEGFAAVGTELTDSPNWAADGMSQHTSYGRANRNRQWGHANGLPMAYYMPTSSGVMTLDTTNARTWRARLGFPSTSPILQFGTTTDIGMVAGGVAPDGATRYGANGMFPAIGETLSARTQGVLAGDTVMTYLSFATFPGGLVISAGARLWLHPAVLIQVGNTTAVGITEVHPLGVVPPVGPLGPLPAQSAVIRAGALTLSSVNQVEIMP